MKELHKKFMQIVDSLIEKKLKKEPIIAIILGGSVARRDETESSAIDIVFYVNRRDLPKDLSRFFLMRYIATCRAVTKGFERFADFKSTMRTR